MRLKRARRWYARQAPRGAHDRFPSPSQGRLRLPARDDPTTGLVAWPGVFAALPGVLEKQLSSNRAVGVAIGDVDDLKGYVEYSKSRDAESFGHLAGNAVLARLGTVARYWLHEFGPRHACLATFGGDEIVVFAETRGLDDFLGHVNDLRDHLGAALPRTVSFGAAVITPDHVPEDVYGDHWWHEFTCRAIGTVEQTLFAYKHARVDSHQAVPTGFVAPATIARP